jgi:hypothetical protein
MATTHAKQSIHWRRSRLAARILLRARAGRLTARDRRLASLLARDPGVTNRLIEQALLSLQAPRRSSHA